MEYNITHYKINSNNTCRFVLVSSGKKTLFVVGLNPSTADDKKPDRTIRRVMGFAKDNGFDSFVMLNLYPQRATKPTDLDKQIDLQILNENIDEIQNIISEIPNPTILAAWSATISVRRYFKECIQQLNEATKDKNINWRKLGESTKEGHPRHPLYAHSSLPMNLFDIENYLTKL
jgi:hypothetical protein